MPRKKFTPAAEPVAVADPGDGTGNESWERGASLNVPVSLPEFIQPEGSGPGSLLTAQDLAEIEMEKAMVAQKQRAQEEAKRAEALARAGSQPGEAQYIFKDIQVGTTGHYRKRSYVRLTPSLCTHVNCMYDASKAVGFSDWSHVPAQSLGSGGTLRDRIIAMKEAHLRTAHNIGGPQKMILSASELAEQKRSWANVPQPFLTSGS